MEITFYIRFSNVTVNSNLNAWTIEYFKLDTNKIKEYYVDILFLLTFDIFIDIFIKIKSELGAPKLQFSVSGRLSSEPEVL